MRNSDRLISSLPKSVFDGLISHARLIAIQSEESSDDTNDHVETLRDQIISKLKSNAGQPITTVGDILRLSQLALLHILDPCLTYVECNRLITRLREDCTVTPISARDILQNSTGKVATGLPTLDKQLQGGFPVGAITEIVGRAGVGKTQLSQQLCVLAAISGRGGSIYIDTENKMSVLRLKEIANERNCGRKRGAREAFSANKTDPADQVLENVTVHSMLSTQELMYALERLEAEINQRNSEAENSGSQNSRRVDRLPVKLIIIDSIAAPIRRDYDLMTSASAKPSSQTSSIQRATAIFQIARKLKQLADDHRLAVVAVNQVGAGGSSFGETGQRNDTLDMNEGEVTASLGTAWQYCISTRIALEHEEDPHFNQKQIHTRKAVITKSLISKKAELNYEVTLQGVREVIPRER